MSDTEYRRESMVVRLVGYAITPLVLVCDGGRWLLFGMFAVAERLDPIEPLLRWSRRLLPLLVEVGRCFEGIARRVKAMIVWLARPLIWLVDRLLPALKVLLRPVARAWQSAVVASEPVRAGLRRCMRWALARRRPLWAMVTRPPQAARRMVARAAAVVMCSVRSRRAP